MQDGKTTARHEAAGEPGPAHFSREELTVTQRKAASLLESGLLLADERACVAGIVTRCADLLGKKRSARASIGNITETEIEEWKNSRSGVPGLILAALTAEGIRNGNYFDTGGPIFPPDSPAFREVPRKTVESAMALLTERKVVRRSGDAWYVYEECEQDAAAADRKRRLHAA